MLKHKNFKLDVEKAGVYLWISIDGQNWLIKEVIDYLKNKYSIELQP